MEYKPSFVDQLDVDYISHHGIKGQHWGVRRFEDASGHLTPAGKRRYDQSPVKATTNRSATKRQQTLRKIGKVAAGAALAGAAGYALYKTGAADAAINAGRNALESKFGIKSEKKSSGDFDKKVISGSSKKRHEASDDIRKANRTLSYQRRKEEASEKRKQTIRDTISNASSNAVAKAKDAIRNKVMDGVDEDDPSTWFNLVTNTKGIVNKATRYGRAVNNLRKGNKIDAAAEISEDIADLTGKIIQGTQDHIEDVRSRRKRKSK